MKPRVFIGSSTEGRKYATGIQSNLQPVNECVIWDQGFFDINKSTFDNLVNNSRDFDFAIFVISPDDITYIREEKYRTTRDNVIFEIGLFIGRLGVGRTYIVRAAGIADLHLPSDLLGITLPGFDANRSDDNWMAALAPACSIIQKKIEEHGPLENRMLSDAKGNEVKYVAAICYQILDGKTQLLLVDTTQQRKMFPKGRLKDGESYTAAAIRYTGSEGGIAARIVEEEPKIFDYYKEAEGENTPVAAVILYAVRPPQMPLKSEPFRNPQWYDLTDIEQHLRDKRQWKNGSDLIDIKDWAESCIDKIKIPRNQAGTIPYRRVDGKIEVLLITSRERGLWIFPKGNLSAHLSSEETAIKETLEEAGVDGKIKKDLGKHTYLRYGIRYNVEMYALEVNKVLDVWPERTQRRREWMRLKDAEENIQREDVKQMLMFFKRKLKT